MSKEAGAEDISAQLETAIAGEAETATAEETVETTEVETPEEGGKSDKTIPYNRFKEVVDQKNTFQGELDSLREQYATTNDSLTKMTQMLEAAKEDSDLVQEIRALANDPNMLPHIEALDKRIRGIEETIEETGEASDDQLDKTRKFLEKQQTKLEAQIAEQQSDLLAQRADAIADKWLESLPEQYDERDRRLIGKLWANAVDFDAVEQDPDSLDQVLAETFQETIDDFGKPRGGLIDPNDPDSYEIEIPETPEITPEQEVAQIVTGKNYAEITEGKAAVSDADFAADMGRLLKIGNRS